MKQDTTMVRLLLYFYLTNKEYSFSEIAEALELYVNGNEFNNLLGKAQKDKLLEYQDYLLTITQKGFDYILKFIGI